MTNDILKTIEDVLKKGDRVELIPVKDGQREKGDAIFGGGLLLSERAAAERAAAERAAAERWALSDREKALVAELGKTKAVIL